MSAFFQNIATRRLSARLKRSHKRDLPYLISYPGAGSHWLRMVVETATGCATGVTPLLRANTLGLNKVALWHAHDCDLTLSGDLGPMIYLFRDPTDVVLSNLFYYKMELLGTDLLDLIVRKIASDYTAHMRAYSEIVSNSPRSTLIMFEDLKSCTQASVTSLFLFVERTGEFGSVPQDFEDAIVKLTKESTRNASTYNKRVMPKTDVNLRGSLKARYSKIIGDVADTEFQRLSEQCQSL